MELNDIRTLIDKYLDGQTSLAEERAIAEYFARESEPAADLLPIKAMFEAMAELRSVAPEVQPESESPTVDLSATKSASRSRGSRWISLGIGLGIAASLAIGLFTTINHKQPTEVDTTPAMICYIDGERIDDIDKAYTETDRILSSVASNVELAMARVDEIKILSLR